MATKKKSKADVQPQAAQNESKALPPAERPASVVEDLAEQLRCRPAQLLNLLRTTCFRNCRKQEEFMMACMVAREYRLNPVLKEIYAFPSQNGVVPIVSVDGWNRIMNSHPMYDGIEFAYDGEVEYDEAGEPTGGGTLSCTAKIHRKDRHNPVCVTEFYEECYRDTDPWNTMPRRMLRWKALIQCARVAFGFAGIYDFDEGNDILAHEGKRVTKDGNIVDAEAVEIAREEDRPVNDLVYEDEPDPTESQDEPVAKVVEAAPPAKEEPAAEEVTEEELAEGGDAEEPAESEDEEFPW